VIVTLSGGESHRLPRKGYQVMPNATRNLLFAFACHHERERGICSSFFGCPTLVVLQGWEKTLLASAALPLRKRVIPRSDEESAVTLSDIILGGVEFGCRRIPAGVLVVSGK
jgi:hypothetical protein